MASAVFGSPSARKTVTFQPSFDKQFARDWLKANPDNDWTLPQEIVDKTIEKYLQAYKMLTGKDLDK